MKILISVCMLLVFAGFSAAQEAKCFRYVGDGFEYQLNLTIGGRNVKGELVVGRVNSEAPSRVYRFSGTILKNDITFNFAGGQVPAAFPAKGSRLTGKLVGAGPTQKLVLKLSDARREVYSAAFESCGT